MYITSRSLPLRLSPSALLPLLICNMLLKSSLKKFSRLAFWHSSLNFYNFLSEVTPVEKCEEKKSLFLSKCGTAKKGLKIMPTFSNDSLYIIKY